MSRILIISHLPSLDNSSTASPSISGSNKNQDQIDKSKMKEKHSSGADPGIGIRGGVSRRGIWGPLKVPSGSRAEPLERVQVGETPSP
jgi:hypothetical protein